MKQLFNDGMVENLLKTAERNFQSSAQNKQWDDTMDLAAKSADMPDDKTAIQESFDYVYDRLGGHEAFLNGRSLIRKICKSFMNGERSLFKKNLRPLCLTARWSLTC